MTSAHHGRGRRRVDPPPAESTRALPDSWLSAAVKAAADSHEPDTGRIRARIADAIVTTPRLIHRTSEDRRARTSRSPRTGPEISGAHRTWHSGSLPAHRRKLIALGATSGVLGVAAVVIGVGVSHSFEDVRPVEVVAVPMPSAGASAGSPAATPSAAVVPDGSGPVPAPAQTDPAPATTNRTPTGGSPAVEITVSAMPSQRVVLPQARTRDWVLYGHGQGATGFERARANVANRGMGRIAVEGGGPTAVTGMSGRFGWSGGWPQATGKDYIERLAVGAPGQLRLTVPMNGSAGLLDLYLGTYGVRGKIQVAVDGRIIESKLLARAEAGRWVDAVVQIAFRPGNARGTLTVIFCPADGTGSSDAGSSDDEQDDEQAGRYDSSGNGGGFKQWQSPQAASAQISLAAAVLSGTQ